MHEQGTARQEASIALVALEHGARMGRRLVNFQSCKFSTISKHLVLLLVLPTEILGNLRLCLIIFYNKHKESLIIKRESTVI